CELQMGRERAKEKIGAVSAETRARGVCEGMYAVFCLTLKGHERKLAETLASPRGFEPPVAPERKQEFFRKICCAIFARNVACEIMATQSTDEIRQENCGHFQAVSHSDRLPVPRIRCVRLSIGPESRGSNFRIMLGQNDEHR